MRSVPRHTAPRKTAIEYVKQAQGADWNDVELTYYLRQVERLLHERGLDLAGFSCCTASGVPS